MSYGTNPLGHQPIYPFQTFNNVDNLGTPSTIGSVKEIKPRPYPVLSGILSLAEEMASRIKDYLLGDGLRHFGLIAALLTTAAIMRKYPASFAIPTLEGNWGKNNGGDHYGHHNW